MNKKTIKKIENAAFGAILAVAVLGCGWCALWILKAIFIAMGVA